MPRAYVNENGNAVERNDWLESNSARDGYVNIGGSAELFTTQYIDNFESYSSTADMLRNWTDDGTGSVTLSSQGMFSRSSQTAYLDNSAQMRSFPGDGLENYPQRGRAWSVYFRPYNTGNNQIYSVLLNLDSNAWANTTNHWRFELQSDSGPRIVRYANGSRNVEATDDNPRLSNQLYKLVMYAAGSNIWFEIFDASGGNETFLNHIETGNGFALDAEMNLGFWNPGNGTSRWDWAVLE